MKQPTLIDTLNKAQRACARQTDVRITVKTLTQTIQQARRAIDSGRLIDAQVLIRNAENMAVEMDDEFAATKRAFERICPMPELPAFLQKQAD